MNSASAMSAADVEALLGEVSRGSVTPKTALNLMVLHGEPRQQAARRIFVALGGSDATELDSEGRARYVGSGKLVADIERAIAE